MPRKKRTKTAADNPARSSELIETQAAETGRLVLNALKNLVTFRLENDKDTFVEWSVFFPRGETHAVKYSRSKVFILKNFISVSFLSALPFEHSRILYTLDF